MNAEQYAAAQAAISAAIAQYVIQFGSFLIRPGMGITEWVQLLQVLYPEVERRRTESAILARTFYDYERAYHVPELTRNDQPLEGTSFQTFIKSMDPVRKKVITASRADMALPEVVDERIVTALSSPRLRNSAVTHLALQTVREVENAGRRQIIHSVKRDQELADIVSKQVEEPQPVVELDEPAPVMKLPTPKEAKILDYKGRPVQQQSSLVRGWARVATGNETCAWCLMLISRGPAYLKASTAGLDLDDESAQEMIAAGEDVSKYMEEWHTGCDCKVVPVFKTSEWPGRDAWKRAEDLWIDASEEARELLEETDEARVYIQGENKGQERSFNDEVINALRRRLERGDIDMSEFAAWAA